MTIINRFAMRNKCDNDNDDDDNDDDDDDVDDDNNVKIVTISATICGRVPFRDPGFCSRNDPCLGL